MKKFNMIKQKIKKSIINVIGNKKEIVSTTIVGSFVDSVGLKGISDIDVVIIVDQLTKNIFEDIISSFETIKGSDFGLDDHQVIINNSFGPLKFNSEKIVVFHVMIYDIEGHINHVEESPFTCFSWESFKPITGLSLRDVYPTLNLQIDDILRSRRGLLTYLSDIEKGCITYRKYKFNNNKLEIIKENFELDLKHNLEYSYHITYHLLNNFYKIITRKINSIEVGDLAKFYLSFEFFPNENLLFFKNLYSWKKKGGKPPENIISSTKLFINDFFSFVESIKLSSKIISFRRHGKTVLNDGTFLGVKRNPSIEALSKRVSDFNYEIGYHSQLLRSIETISHFNCNLLIESSLLNEIDYGLAEGLAISQLHSKFPDIILKWEEGQDPKFPEGECQNDVLNRVRSFLNNKLDVNKDSIVITHLVVLRLILFNYLNLDFKNLFKINIEHIEGFDALNFNQYFSIEISKETRRRIRKQLSILDD